jgi:hypothetical protein
MLTITIIGTPVPNKVQHSLAVVHPIRVLVQAVRRMIFGQPEWELILALILVLPQTMAHTGQTHSATKAFGGPAQLRNPLSRVVAKVILAVDQVQDALMKIFTQPRLVLLHECILP